MPSHIEGAATAAVERRTKARDVLIMIVQEGWKQHRRDPGGTRRWEKSKPQRQVNSSVDPCARAGTDEPACRRQQRSRYRSWAPPAERQVHLVRLWDCWCGGSVPRSSSVHL